MKSHSLLAVARTAMGTVARTAVAAVAGVLALGAVTVPAMAAPQGTAGGSAAALAGESAAPAPASSGPALRAYRVAPQWGNCPASVAQAPFQCATVPVPLDYRAPGGARIELSLIRLPAADPKERLGSLFVNFGGPGGSGVDILPARATTVFSAAIRTTSTWSPGTRGEPASPPPSAASRLSRTTAATSARATT